MKEIIAVYQDCVLCGSNGRQKIADYAKKGIAIRKVGFTTEEGKELIHRAVFDHKIGQMPFYTDGVNFTTKLDEICNDSRGEVKESLKKPRSRKKAQNLRRDRNQLTKE